MSTSMPLTIEAAVRLITIRLMRERAGSERMTLPEWEAFVRAILERVEKREPRP